MLRITSRFACQTARCGKIAAGLAIATVFILATALPAAAQLVFSSDCRNYQPIAVAPPNDAILFTKQPVPHPNGTASVFAINGLDTYVIPAGANSCIVAAPHANDNYCFIARNDNTIDGVGFAPIRNPGGLTACQ
ncbi:MULTISPECIES: hypothetical protein [Rhizobium]|uniref:hypothetical protein n=1 Tax=Rhizobium TaxID=379 RepID=UPI001C82BC0F|nr:MULTISPECIES: hypothetical protein [Rhizobium]MBX4917527.1 hypothetical protein [Rhizobium bangladeshense]MBX5139157.1 hypothetical protein [Rhizobium lentis]